MKIKPPSLNRSLANVKSDSFASFVVFLVALPLCMGTALGSGAPVTAGLITGIVGGVAVGLLSGCPLQISGPSAGLAVIVYDVVLRFGLDSLGPILVVAGLLQMVAASLRLGKWFRAVSPTVVQGMLAGIGVLIVTSQLHVMLDSKPQSDGLRNIASLPRTLVSAIAKPHVHSSELRTIHRSALQTLGPMHVEQTRIRRLCESQSGEPADESTRTSLSERQQRVTIQVAALADQIRRMAEVAGCDGRCQRIVEAVRAAQVSSEAATKALKSDVSVNIMRTQRGATESLEVLQGTLKNHNLAAGIGALAFITLLAWRRLAPKVLQVVPPQLVAIVGATVVAILFNMPVVYVEVPQRLMDGFTPPDMAGMFGPKMLEQILASILIAVVASAETLLCATAVDQLHSGPRTQYDRELLAQGIGNSICGIFGGLPVSGAIVRSSTNVQAGGQSRLSAILHGFWLLAFISALGAALRLIPASCLAAVLVYAGAKLVDLSFVKQLRRFGVGEVITYWSTFAGVIAFNLLTGVLIGVTISAGRLIWRFTRLSIHWQKGPFNQATLKLTGAATFIRLPRLATELELIRPSAAITLDTSELSYIDHACLSLLQSWTRRHVAGGGAVLVSWADIVHKLDASPSLDPDVLGLARFSCSTPGRSLSRSELAA
jgi:MFS superfamily sulfate permease-like transporter